MVPGQNTVLQKGVEKVFNAILIRSGITLVVVVAFSISTMFYNLSSDYPFFMTMFLQIVTFVGIYSKLPDILGMFRVQADGQQVGKRLFQKPRMLMRRQTRRMERKFKNAFKAGTAGAAVGAAGSLAGSGQMKSSSRPGQRENLGTRTGKKVGTVLDVPQKAVDKVKSAKEKVKDVPTQVKYGVYRNAKDFKDNVVEEPGRKTEERKEKLQNYKQTVGEKRQEMQKRRQEKAEGKRQKEMQEPDHRRSATVQRTQKMEPEKDRSREHNVESVSEQGQKRPNVSSDVSTSRGTSFAEKERSKERSSSNFASRELNKERTSFKAVHQDKVSQQMPKRQNRERRGKQ